MELLIIQYTLATILSMIIISMPFRIILMVRDAPYKIWILNNK